MSNLVFRKTESGKEEIALRKAGLALATRQLLILVNGVDNVHVLLAKGLGDVRGHLDTLLALRLIEPVPAAPPVAPPPAARAPVAAPAPPPSPSPASAAPPLAPPVDEAQALLTLQRRAYLALQPHFGPDTPTVAQALLAARTLADYRLALDGIAAKLAIYMGRKQAEREVSALRG